MNESVRLTLLILALLGATACSDEETLSQYILCSPHITSLELEEGQTLSSGGGTLLMSGRNLWDYFSGTETTPVPLEDMTGLVIRVGAQSAVLEAAWEVTLPGVENSDLEAGTPGVTVVESTCATCQTCISDNEYGCGGCDDACSGCRQVIRFSFPQLLLTSPPLDAEGNALLSVRFYGASGESAPVALAVPAACSDGLDNDFDGTSDELDSDCGLSRWSEWDACLDGLDNDQDGWIDLQDPSCVNTDSAILELPACGDGLDNDSDGFIDADDPDCQNDLSSLSETDYLAAPACANGLDDDGDGQIDSDDARCLDGSDTDESSP